MDRGAGDCSCGDVYACVDRARAVAAEGAPARDAVMAALEDLRRVRAWADAQELVWFRHLRRCSPEPGSDLAKAAHRSRSHGAEVMSRAHAVDAIAGLGEAIEKGSLDGAHATVAAKVLASMPAALKAAAAVRFALESTWYQLTRMIQRHPSFQLLDEQEVAFQTVLAKVRARELSTEPTTIIIRSGPGTGKSVVAVNLVAALSRAGRSVVHATGSKAFTSDLRRSVGTRASENSPISTGSVQSLRGRSTYWSATKRIGFASPVRAASRRPMPALGSSRSRSCATSRRSACSSSTMRKSRGRARSGRPI